MNTKYFASIEHSKKLAHLFPGAEWWLIDHVKCPVEPELIKKGKRLDKKVDSGMWNKYPALHTDMLLEIAPYKIKLKEKKSIGSYGTKRELFLKIIKTPIGYRCDYCCLINENTIRDLSWIEKSLPNALSKVVKWLDEQGLIKDVGNGSKD